MTRYAGQLLAPAEGLPILGHFWCSVVTLVTFSSKLDNFAKKSKKIPILGRFCFSVVGLVTLSSNLNSFAKNPKKYKNTKKIQKISKKFKKCQKINIQNPKNLYFFGKCQKI